MGGTSPYAWTCEYPPGPSISTLPTEICPWKFKIGREGIKTILLKILATFRFHFICPCLPGKKQANIFFSLDYNTKQTWKIDVVCSRFLKSDKKVGACIIHTCHHCIHNMQACEWVQWVHFTPFLEVIWSKKPHLFTLDQGWFHIRARLTTIFYF